MTELQRGVGATRTQRPSGISAKRKHHAEISSKLVLLIISIHMRHTRAHSIAYTTIDPVDSRPRRPAASHSRTVICIKSKQSYQR